MTDDALEQRNDKMLAQIHPSIRPKVAAVMKDLRGHGWRPRIQQAHRSAEQQANYVAAGNSKVKFSYHMATGKNGKPEALAADILDDDNLTYQDEDDARRFHLRLAASAWAHGLNTGTLWGLGQAKKAAVLAAVAAKDWDAVVVLGWDAGHVECKGITLAQARRGIRPEVRVSISWDLSGDPAGRDPGKPRRPHETPSSAASTPGGDRSA
jgi:hypothetical protein